MADSGALQHEYEVYIRTTPQKLWDALTRGESTSRYFHRTRIESDWRPGSPVIFHSSRPGEIAVEGVVREAAFPCRLAYTWNVRYDPERAGEEASLVTWEITPLDEVCRLTLVHRISAPSKTWREVKSGWDAILSSLKSWLETGEGLSLTS